MGGGGNSEGRKREEKVRREEQESNEGYGTKGGKMLKMGGGVKQSDGRYERCPNPSRLADKSATHLLPYCPAKLLLGSHRGCSLEGRERAKKTEIRRVMEAEGTLNSLTQTIRSDHGECRAQYLTNLQCVAVF